ncbi:acyltransferase family protein [Roseomonas chloroacetimidivorans]|jgi:peptidoglycan/LPS O-acetylase OafA/YrhL|uniref:acyltransferase family protein n=1 Tax=Roseomonas chloroacetimidivorans TaxID=1766656 RepID=UPI003C768191
MHDKKNFIQWLRALAATEVVIWHSDLVTKHFSPTKIQNSSYDYLGGFGVELFFIISGYVICLSAPRYESGVQFILARLARLAPFYWLFTALVFLASWINPRWTLGSLDPSAGAIIKSLLFLPQREMPTLAPGWSLEHEMIFYAIVAAWLLAFRRLTARGQAGVAALLFLLGAAGFFLGTGLAERIWDYHLLSPYMLAFGIGWLFCIADAAAGKTRLVLYAVPFAALLLLTIAPIEAAEHTLLHRTIFAAALYVLASSVRDHLETNAPVNQAVARIGDASYTIYLSHWFCLSITGKVLGAVGPVSELDTLFRLAASGACIAVGLWLYERFERPLDQTLKNMIRFKRRLRPALATSSS